MTTEEGVLGAALCKIAREIAPLNTAKTISRRWKIQQVTADNVLKGIASGRTLVKALRAEGGKAWDLWNALGELVIGESRHDRDRREVERLIGAAAQAQSKIARRAQIQALECGLQELTTNADNGKGE